MTQATTQLNSSVLSQASGPALAPATNNKAACANCEGKDEPSFAQLLAENGVLSTELVESASDHPDGTSLTDQLPTDGAPVEQNTRTLSSQLTPDFIRLALAGDLASKTVKTNGSPSLVPVSEGAGKPEMQPAPPGGSASSLTSLQAMPIAPAQNLSTIESPQKGDGKALATHSPITSQGQTMSDMLTPANENPQNNNFETALAEQSDGTPAHLTPEAEKGQQNKNIAQEPIVMTPVADNDVDNLNAPVSNTNETPLNAAAVKAENKLDKPVPDTLALAPTIGVSDKSQTAHTSTKSQSMESGRMETGAPASAPGTNAAAQQDNASGNDNKSGEKGENASSLMDRLKPLQEASPRFSPLDTIAGDTSKTAGINSLNTAPLNGAPTITLPAATRGPLNQPLPQVPLNNMAVHIAAQARAGNQQFNIRLDPPELGRIDIRMEIASDGQTLTHLAVEKTETLDLLRQDSRALERALTNAGLDQRNGSLSFSLKDDNQNRQQAANDDDRKGNPYKDPDNSDADNHEAVTSRTLNVSSGLDISI